MKDNYQYVRVRILEPFQIVTFKSKAGRGLALEEAVKRAMEFVDGEVEVLTYDQAGLDDMIESANQLHYLKRREAKETSNSNDIPDITA